MTAKAQRSGEGTTIDDLEASIMAAHTLRGVGLHGLLRSPRKRAFVAAAAAAAAPTEGAESRRARKYGAR